MKKQPAAKNPEPSNVVPIQKSIREVGEELAALLKASEQIGQTLSDLRHLVQPAAAPAAEPAAPAPEVDLLRMEVMGLEPKEQEAIRARLICKIIKPLEDLFLPYVQEIAQFVDLVENDDGCITPVEELITYLVNIHYRYGLTPENVAHELQEFRENYDCVREREKRFTAAYSRHRE